MMTGKHRKEEGFTLIEVMISLLVFMVSLLGLVALQEASIEGANKGREQTAAINVARFVMAEIQNEVTSFTFVSDIPTSAGQPLLDNAINGGNEGKWVLLPDAAVDSRFDAYLEHNARDFYDVDSAPFCATYWVERFVPGDGSGERLEGLYKVRVRISWPRKGQYGTGGAWKACNARTTDTTAVMAPWESVELRTVMSREFTSRWVF